MIPLHASAPVESLVVTKPEGHPPPKQCECGAIGPHRRREHEEAMWLLRLDQDRERLRGERWP